MRKLCFLIFWLGVTVVSGGATDWYADNSASGANTGVSWANAWQSLSAINWGSLSPGDTLYISGGSSSKTYSEKLQVGVSGSPGSPIVISVGQSAGHNGTVIISPPSGYGIGLGSKTYVTITGSYGGDQRIKVQNCDTTGIELYGSMHDIILEYLEVNNNGDANNENGITLQANDYDGQIVEIRYSKIHDNYQDQIFCNGPTNQGNRYGRILVHHNDIYNLNDDGFEATAGGIDFYNNTVHGRGSSGASGHPDGIQFQKGYVRVWNNKFYNFSSGDLVSNSYIFIGLYSGGSSLDAAHIRVYNNLIYEEGTSTIVGFDPLRGIAFKADVDITSVRDVVIANNTIANTPAWGLTLTFNNLGSAAVDNVIVENNIIYNCFTSSGGQAVLIGDGSYTLGSDGDAVDVIIDYNAIHAGPEGSSKIGHDGIKSYSDWVASTGAQDHGIADNPNLSVDYQLDDSSTLINSGRDLGPYFTTDIDGIPRPRGSFWDIGAYEHLIGAASSPDSPTGLRIQ